jgi:molybdopterin/thiamine biosynthesis adenylyltransferase
VRGDEDRLVGAGVDLTSLGEASAVVVVDGMMGGEPWAHPAWALCRGLGALGFGSVELRGAQEYAPAFSLLMQGTAFRHLPAPLTGGPAPERPGGSEIVLHLGGDPLSQEWGADYAARRSSHFLSIRWGGSWVEMISSAPASVCDPALELAADEEPTAPLSRIAAGLALQEALIRVGQLDLAAPADARVSFDAAAETRRLESESVSCPWPRIEDAVIELIGCGAVGSNLLECFAPLLGRGCELRLFDFDVVAPQNLAIQAAFSPEDLGRPKAEVMAEGLATLCEPSLAIRPVTRRYEERPAALSRPSLRIVCPDTFAARLYCNRRSLEDGVPLVEAGCSPLVAQVRSYRPSATACLEHRIGNLPQRAASERNRATCAQEHAFTLPGTSMVCGGLLAAEALRTLDPGRFGPASLGTIAYDARFGRRFGVVEVRPACSHGEQRTGAVPDPAPTTSSGDTPRRESYARKVRELGSVT